MRIFWILAFGVFLASCQDQVNFNLSPNGSRLDLRKSSISISTQPVKSALTLNFTGLKLFDRLYVVAGANDKCENGRDVGFGFIYDQNFQSLTIHNTKDISSVRVLIYNTGERVCSDEISFQLTSDKANPFIGVREMMSSEFTETSRTSFQDERPASAILDFSIPSFDSANGVVTRVAPYQRVATGDEHSCAVLSTGQVSCWGRNDKGQLGDGTYNNSLIPRLIPSLSNVISISAGQYFSCALHSNGRISCWGEGYWGQLGHGLAEDSNVPVIVSGITDAVELSANGSTSCALLRNGKINCWGYGNYGQMGTGTNQAQNLSIHEVQNITNAVGVRVGNLIVCALLADGKINCWGEGGLGRLGHGSDDSSNIPVEVVGISDAIGLSAYKHSCAVLSDGRLNCWGGNFSGQLSVPSEDLSVTNVPVEAQGIANAVGVYTGENITCVLMATGKVNCIGARFVFSETPVEVQNVSNAVGMSIGYYNACFLLDEGYVKCLGSGYYGQLGNGQSSNANTVPVDVNFPQDIIFGYVAKPVTSPILSLSKNSFAHNCFVSDERSVECWGQNYEGQLGNGSNDEVKGRSEVVGISNAVSVGVGDGFSCALLSSGRISCWGQNSQGQLGNNSTEASFVPVDVFGIENAVALSVGQNFSCALLLDGKVNCWGNNSNGRLGNNSNIQSNSPVEVIEVTNAVSIEVGSGHACALLRTGLVFCWGANGNYQLGSGANNSINNPRQMRDMQNVAGLALGNGHTCILKQNGNVECVGRQLGTGGSGTNKYQISGFSPLLKIASGPNHLCGITTTGAIECVGAGSSGELGNGVSSNSSTPVAVQGITNAVDISLGYGKSCATTEERKLICWGTNDAADPELADSKRLVEKFPYSNYWIGPNSVCFLTKDKRVQCVGRGIDLGIAVSDEMIDYKLTDTNPIDDISDVTSVTISYGATCALTSIGRVYCWGQAIGTSGVIQEILVGGSDRFVKVIKHSGQFLGLTQQGKLFSWINQGSLYEVTTSISFTPIDIIGDGNGRVCALQANGKVFCKGGNYYGELGVDPSVMSYLSDFTEIPALEGVKGLKLLDGHTCGIFGANNELRCIGANYQGQIGMNPSEGYSSSTLVSKGITGVSLIVEETGGRTFFLKNELLYGFDNNGELVNFELGTIKNIKYSNMGFYIVIGDEKNFILFAPIEYAYSRERFFSQDNGTTSPSLFWEM